MNWNTWKNKGLVDMLEKKPTDTKTKNNNPQIYFATKNNNGQCDNYRVWSIKENDDDKTPVPQLICRRNEEVGNIYRVSGTLFDESVHENESRGQIYITLEDKFGQNPLPNPPSGLLRVSTNVYSTDRKAIVNLMDNKIVFSKPGFEITALYIDSGLQNHVPEAYKQQKITQPKPKIPERTPRKKSRRMDSAARLMMLHKDRLQRKK